jgi:hypothetical protein
VAAAALPEVLNPLRRQHGAQRLEACSCRRGGVRRQVAVRGGGGGSESSGSSVKVVAAMRSGDTNQRRWGGGDDGMRWYAAANERQGKLPVPGTDCYLLLKCSMKHMKR